jgi:hypothetical protein
MTSLTDRWILVAGGTGKVGRARLSLSRHQPEATP